MRISGEIDGAAAESLATGPEGAWAATTTGILHLGEGTVLRRTVALPGEVAARPSLSASGVLAGGWRVLDNREPVRIWPAAALLPEGTGEAYGSVTSAWSGAGVAIALTAWQPRRRVEPATPEAVEGQLLLVDDEGSRFGTLLADIPDWRPVAVAADGDRVAAVGRAVAVWGIDGTAVLAPAFDRLRRVSVALRGDVLVAGCVNGAVEVRHGMNSPVGWAAHSRRIAAVAVSPDAAVMATGGDDGAVRLWTVDGAPLSDLEVGQPVESLAFTADGSELLAGLRLPGRLVRVDIG